MKKQSLFFLSLILLLTVLSACKKKPEEEKPQTCTQTFDITGIHAGAGVRVDYYEPYNELSYEMVVTLDFDSKQLTTGDCQAPIDSFVGKVDTVIVIGLYDYNANYHAGDCFNGLMDMVGATMFTTQQGQSLSDYLQANPQPTTLYMESHTPPDTSITEQFVVTYKLQDGRTFVDTTRAIDIDLPNN